MVTGRYENYTKFKDIKIAHCYLLKALEIRYNTVYLTCSQKLMGTSQLEGRSVVPRSSVPGHLSP